MLDDYFGFVLPKRLGTLSTRFSEVTTIPPSQGSVFRVVQFGTSWSGNSAAYSANFVARMAADYASPVHHTNCDRSRIDHD